jgi:hypothetical protein
MLFVGRMLLNSSRKAHCGPSNKIVGHCTGRQNRIVEILFRLMSSFTIGTYS